MNIGALLFQQSLPFVVELDGDIDGNAFSIKGKGVGDASKGKLEAKFICTTGELPIPWACVQSTLGYGMFCFANYKDTNIKDYFKSCFPEGYVQERTTTYENDGTLTTRAELTFENGIIYNRIKLNGQGFKKGGNILGKKLTLNYPHSCIYFYPDGDDVRATFKKIYPVVEGGYQVSSTSQHNYSLASDGLTLSPKVHHLTSGVKLTKDPEEKRDHVCMVEMLHPVDCEKYFH